MQPDVLGLIILGICVVLFLTERLPLAVTGCLGCLLMVLTRVASFQEVFSGFSSSIVLLMASTMIVGIAMFQTGAAQVIGKAIIRWSRGNEWIFLGGKLCSDRVGFHVSGQYRYPFRLYSYIQKLLLCFSLSIRFC